MAQAAAAEFCFFGDADRVKNGKNRGRISGEYPSWTFDRGVDALKEEIDQATRMLDRGQIPDIAIAQAKITLREKQEKLAEILDGRPKLSGEQTDHVAKLREYMGREIADIMPTGTEMQKGLADAHAEASKMLKPCIKVDKFAATCKANGIPVHKGMITRNDAQRLWKLAGHALGEETRVQTLRRDSAPGLIRFNRGLQDQIDNARG